MQGVKGEPNYQVKERHKNKKWAVVFDVGERRVGLMESLM